MSIVGHTSGNLNDVRAYPFADSASLIDDTGRLLPEYALNDCHIWWPDIYGSVGYVSAVTISPSLITAVFSAYDEDAGVSTAVAALSVPLPATPYRSYAVQAMQGGVGGWAAVGRVPTAAAVETWLFSTPASARLLSRLAQAYPIYPVRTLGEYENPTALKGHVNLVAAGGLLIEEGVRQIDGEDKRCIVFGLDPDQLPGLYELFAGPCGKRPESQTCDKTPIRTINGVEPDCNGLLYLEVDDSTGVLEGKLDITDDAEGDNGGVALFTPVEVPDVCEPVSRFDPRYEDECALQSSSSVAVVVESSSSAIPIEELSSSLAVSEVSYPMDDPDELLDWALFDGPSKDHYVADWEPATSSFGGTYWPTMENSQLVLPSSDELNERLLFNNAYRVSLNTEGHSGRITISYGIPYSDLLDMEIGSDYERVVHIYLETEKLSSDLEHRGWRLRLCYRRTSASELLLIARVQFSDGSGSWQDAGGTTANETFLLQMVSSSSSDFGELLAQTAFLQLSPTDIAMGQYDITWGINDFSETVAFADSSGGYTDAQFFAVSWRSVVPDPQTEAVPSTRLYIEQIDISANDLVRQECNENDVETASDLPYALKFDPDPGWSNDFYITRARNQMERKPDSSLMAYQSLLIQNDAIYVPRQYIDALTKNHKYAILSCIDAIAGDYVVSVAFKYVSQQPKVGIVVGYQTEDTRDLFWAVMVDLVGRRITYGIHVSPHVFIPVGWEALSVSGDSWPYEWHRLIVRMTGGPSTFAVSAWIDTDAFASSSSLAATKTIELDYNNPDYARTGLAAWNGSVSAFMFADGRVGVYAYDGAARFAELTVSPDEQDIVVPNKLPWLVR